MLMLPSLRSRGLWSLSICRRYATESVLSPEQNEYYRTPEQDPTKHQKKHLGRLYTIPETVYSLPEASTPEFIRAYRFLPKDYEKRCNVMREPVIMIREPAVDIIDTVNRLDWEKAKCPLKFILFGKPGNGKTLTLCHLRHFVQATPDLILLNFTRMSSWLHRYAQIAESSHKPGRYDHIADSQNFLRNFAHRNGDKIENLKTHQSYLWSIREKTESGSPLSNILHQGIDRPKFAADCLNVFLKELKLHANEGNCKLAIFVDGLNALYKEDTYVCKDWSVGEKVVHSWKVRQRLCHVDDLSVMLALKKLITNDYKNSVVIGSVDNNEIFPSGIHDRYLKNVYRSKWWKELEKNMIPEMESHFPFALLGDEGSKFVDPFIPVEIKPFSDAEMDVLIDYNVHKRYIKSIAASDAGRQEIKFLCGGNGADFMRFATLW